MRNIESSSFKFPDFEETPTTQLKFGDYVVNQVLEEDEKKAPVAATAEAEYRAAKKRHLEEMVDAYATAHKCSWEKACAKLDVIDPDTIE